MSEIELKVIEEIRDETIRVEEFELSGDAVVKKLKELVREGSVRRITIKNVEGETLLEIPFTLGLAGMAAGVMLAPFWLAVGLIATVVAQLKIVVERIE